MLELKQTEYPLNGNKALKSPFVSVALTRQEETVLDKLLSYQAVDSFHTSNQACTVAITQSCIGITEVPAQC
jgi:hypothetical protein